MKNDEFGDRMKAYESVFTTDRINPESILCVRIDGKNFSKFTKPFNKPFDHVLSSMMVSTMKHLVNETHAQIGFTQSDEITLIYTLGEKASEYIFGGKVSKINSILASMATAQFNYLVIREASHITNRFAYFDCRCWEVPSLVEASNVILWRAQDAKKNSVSSWFRFIAGAKKMHGMNQQQMKDHIRESMGLEWDDLPNKFKYGTFVKPEIHLESLTPHQLNQIPEKNRPDNGKVSRRSIKVQDIGYFGDMTLEERMEFVK